MTARSFFLLQDVIKLNDPGDKEFVASRDINNFVHLSEVREERVAELSKVAHADKIRQTKSTELIFR